MELSRCNPGKPLGFVEMNNQGALLCGSVEFSVSGMLVETSEYFIGVSRLPLTTAWLFGAYLSQFCVGTTDLRECWDTVSESRVLEWVFYLASVLC